MGKDILLLSIGALFGVGVALVSLALPIYLPTLPGWVAQWMFWGGWTLMAIMVIDAALLYFWGEREGQKLWPAILINLAVCLAVLGFVWHYSSEGDPNNKFSGLYVFAATGNNTLHAMLLNKGNQRFHNVSIEIIPITKDKPRKGVGHKFYPFVDPYGINLNIEFESGDYFIEIRSDEAATKESLSVDWTNGIFQQEVTIRKDDKIIFHKKETLDR